MRNTALKCLRITPNYTGDTKKENFKNSKPVVYARVKEVPEENMIALQYFFFYPGSYIPKTLGRFQLPWHEGDTEYAEIILDKTSLQPLGAHASAHYYGTSYPWDKLLFSEDGRVKMYVAQHAHATYFFPSKFPGYQCMGGNLGFGGETTLSIKTLWDVAKEDNEVNYELQPLNDDHIIFTWKGIWGGKKRRHPADIDSLKSRVMGPRSFAYRNALSGKLSMWERPEVPFYFYYLPSGFYQRLVRSINSVDNADIRDEMFDIVFRIGRLRAKVDRSLNTKYRSLNRWQKRVLAEAVPFVVLSVSQDALEQIWEHGKEKVGITDFQEMVRKIAKKQLKLVQKFIRIGKKDSPEVHKDSLNLFSLSPDQLLKVLTKLTKLEPNLIYEIYQSSHLKLNPDRKQVEIFNLLYE
jgi:hypothetical protein